MKKINLLSKEKQRELAIGILKETDKNKISLNDEEHDFIQGLFSSKI